MIQQALTTLLTLSCSLGLVLFFIKMIIPHQQEKSNKFIHQNTTENETTYDEILWDCEAEEASN